MTDTQNSDVPDENGETQTTFQSDSTNGNDDDWTVIDEVLESDEDENTVFANKQLADSSYVVDEDRIYGRDEHLAEEAKAFKDTLKGERPPDLLLYGASDTGKSVTIKTVAKKVKQRCENRGIRFTAISTNFKHMETHTLDRAVWKLRWQTARTAGVEWDVPTKGISTDTKYTCLYEIIRGMATQKKLSLYAAAVAATQGTTRTAPSPAVYDIYTYICEQIDADIYTQETVNSHIGKGETYGLLDIERTSRGSRTGVYLIFSFYKNSDIVLSIIEEDSRVAGADLLLSEASLTLKFEGTTFN